MSLLRKLYRKILSEEFRFKLFYKYRWKPKLGTLDHYIYNSINNRKDFFFIQIGSNDGKTNDPLYKFTKTKKISGILIEPVKFLFEKLKETYKNNPNVVFENVAIVKEVGEALKFFRVEDSVTFPYWANQLGSFRKEIILKHKESIENIENYIIEEDILQITFSMLIEKHKLKKIDLLHIDTEGYDYEIIKSIDFGTIKPFMILFENVHLTPLELTACYDVLKAQNYKLVQLGNDTLAIQY